MHPFKRPAFHPATRLQHWQRMSSRLGSVRHRPKPKLSLRPRTLSYHVCRAQHDPEWPISQRTRVFFESGTSRSSRRPRAATYS